MPRVVKCWSCNSSIEDVHIGTCPAQKGIVIFNSGSTLLVESADKQTIQFVRVQPNIAHLPLDPAARKATPLWTGLVKYFPDALVAVAQLSHKAGAQHHPGQPVHWEREKSTDHHDTLMRHLWDSGTSDTDGIAHSAKVAWRALAILQLEIEKERGCSLPGEL